MWLRFSETKKSTVVDKFKELTQRDDVGILLINQNVRGLVLLAQVCILNGVVQPIDFVMMQVAEDIREVLNLYQQMYPTILEIPSKDHPYEC